MTHQAYAAAPPLSEFGPFTIHTGQTWDPTTVLHDPALRCVAIARHPDGWVALADTKQLLAVQQPLIFTEGEWTAFAHALAEGRF